MHDAAFIGDALFFPRDIKKQAIPQYPYPMPHILVAHGLMRFISLFAQILDQGAPLSHVHHLHAAADAEDRDVSLDRATRKGELEVVAGDAKYESPVGEHGEFYLDGVPAWAELDWIGREVEIGGIRFRAALRTRRCAAIDVNPESAARDANLPKAIMQHVGHTDLGIYLEVLSDGVCSVGDAVMVAAA